ncbi:hypothetical protein D3C81_1664980 [compost metagenome]
MISIGHIPEIKISFVAQKNPVVIKSLQLVSKLDQSIQRIVHDRKLNTKAILVMIQPDLIR